MGRQEHAFIPHHTAVTAHKCSISKERSSFRANAEGREREIMQKIFEVWLKITSHSDCYLYRLFVINYCFKKTGGFCAMRGDLSIFLFNADSEFHAFFVVLKGGFTQAQFVIFKSPPSHHFKVEQLMDSFIVSHLKYLSSALPFCNSDRNPLTDEVEPLLGGGRT